METIQTGFDHLLRENPMGEARKDALKLDFDHRLKLEFHGTKVTSDADTNDAERLCVDPAMRHVAGGRAIERTAASTSLIHGQI